MESLRIEEITRISERMEKERAKREMIARLSVANKFILVIAVVICLTLIVSNLAATFLQEIAQSALYKAIFYDDCVKYSQLSKCQ